ncbi:unnamed protein product [Effrenium voratum]|nr:unnamed protein product [Effrenium voratum]CAJ1347926.1 unnamed protein product [Effrenium voratum]CAJ1376164.1 unnamed protein product [Effrenium voratum]CAJ1420676.1 unnamed protein product [Effrenium voratum]|eukprot:CAMPEP_0181421406 /NCGR_PEP_ID=MMETSP1110-20121109/13082_1 /TAXON_ID=174948 /ORGANISM="Symbiodinium sp., Strain CCMP421" /LENGTH=405 /DNA_ID=CAMNT_0023544471 /DNA_START=44 /DNA_END=1261 /DNA_ORIENTATION=+
MSHRKFERPRHGSLGFLPRKRTRHHHGKIKSFPKDDQAKPPHLTAFMSYKAGMTHIVREVDRPGSKLHKKEIVEPVTILESPPMVVVGFVGYVETPRGLRALTSVWAGHLSEECKRRFYKTWKGRKHKAFTKYEKRWSEASKEGTPMQAEVERAKKYCQVIRAICHTQVRKVKIGQKKAHIKEIQVNGGTTEQKVDFAMNLFEQEVKIADCFSQDETIDIVGTTKGKGFNGVVTRWGVTRLVRKSHRGLRKVACIGSWHPARVSFQVPRSGQRGYHHRTEINKKIYRIGKSLKDDPANARTDNDLTEKAITPMGGFSHYGEVNEDWVMLKGTVMGPRKRLITLRKSLLPQVSRKALEKVTLKFIDTSSKFGHGRFQTSEEKAKFFGAALKKAKTEKAEKAEKEEA